jgi:hypothetical protein
MNRALVVGALLCLLAILLSVPAIVGGMLEADWLPPTPTLKTEAAPYSAQGGGHVSATAIQIAMKTATATPTAVLYVVLGEWYCRSAPALGAGVVQTMRAGEVVTVGGKQDGWVYLSEPGCWVAQVAISVR